MVEKCLLERDPLIEIEPEDFSEADSTILVRERMRGTKLEGAFKQVRGTVVGQSEHTISILPKTGKKTTYSKRDVAWQSKEAKAPQCSSSKNLPKPKKMAKLNKKAKEEKRTEMGTTPKWTKMAIDTESSEDDREQVIQPAAVQPTVEREQKLPKIKINESSEEDAIEQTEEENEAELEKEDEQETSANKQNAPSTSGAKGVPIKGSVKWEKRASSRVTKKPDRLGNNIMISKIEPDQSSQEEESLPSVYEIKKPNERLPENH